VHALQGGQWLKLDGLGYGDHVNKKEILATGGKWKRKKPAILLVQHPVLRLVDAYQSIVLKKLFR